MKDFWQGDIPGVEGIEDLLEKGVIIQFGQPPNRIDLISEIENVTFEEAWQSKEIVELISEKRNIPIYYIGLDQLISNKKKINRAKDLDDLKYLQKVQSQFKKRNSSFNG